MSQADAPAADWYPDPSERFQFRYWDGETWTGHVSTDGKTDWDPPAEAPADAGGSQSAAQVDDHGIGAGVAATPADTDVQVAVQHEEAAVQADAGTSQGAASTAQGDSTWAPQAQEQTVGQALVEGSDTSTAAVGGTIEEGEPSDTNLVANQRAGVDPDVQSWLDEVAGQVEPRLSRINEEWTSQPQAEAARACAYGLLVGHLAHLHPHMRGELSQVAEAHPSFTTLEAGARLDTLEQIAGDPQRTAAWLGPLIGTEDAQRVQMLFD